MKKDYQTIVDEILEHLSKSGKMYYSDFYVGVTNDVEQRMFKEHNVSKDKAWWIFRTADNADIARKVEAHFLKLGMRGDNKGGDDASDIVYCYAVSPTTAE